MMMALHSTILLLLLCKAWAPPLKLQLHAQVKKASCKPRPAAQTGYIAHMDLLAPTACDALGCAGTIAPQRFTTVGFGHTPLSPLGQSTGHTSMKMCD
jgi:hypothetical protein